MFRDAVLSDCLKYRYRLTREWSIGPTMAFVMLNPSTADALVDDPTIRRCIGFANREGCGRIEVVNLFAYRATNPAELLTVADPVGPGNAAAVQLALQEAKSIVVAWGAGVAPQLGTHAQVVKTILAGYNLTCLGLTKGDEPRHPLYVAGDQPLLMFPSRTPVGYPDLADTANRQTNTP